MDLDVLKKESGRTREMTPFIEHLFANKLLLAIAITGCLMVVHFLVQYLGRAIPLRVELRRLSRNVRSLKDTSRAELKSSLDDLFSKSRFRFAWSEFEETLHDQHDIVRGERRIVDVRATIPAESFFHPGSAIDPSLGSEYFKHLPGILTGLGIIGTFMGLIEGLVEFDPSVIESVEPRKGLEGLFGQVKYAFMFSASAIGAAIIITALEKWLYASCAKWVGELAQSLDGLFRFGVGEEYLSNLVRVSTESATQVRQLKESLVDELKALLTNLTERQIQATQQLSNDFGTQIERSLQAPMEKIAETVRLASGGQHQAVGAVLENLMTSFLAQMRESMGGQIGDLSALLQQSAQSMSQVELSMRTLVADMQKASTESSAGVQSAMRDLMLALGEHQQAQSRSVSATTQVVLDKLQQAIARMAEAHEETNRRSQEAVTSVSNAMQGRIAALTDSNNQTIASTQAAIDRIGSVSQDTGEKLAVGATAISSVVAAMGQTSAQMAELARQLASLEGRSLQSSQALAQSTSQLGVASQGLSTAITQLGVTSVQLEGVASAAAADTDMRSKLLRDLQEVVGRSERASVEFAKLAEQLRGNVSDSVEHFGSKVGDVLSKHLFEYQKQLGDAVSMLAGALEQLAEHAAGAEEA
jgi:hypothetical protein